MDSWNVYIARCADGSLYTGIAKNVDKRIKEHNHNDALAAKYTRSRRPVVTVYQQAVTSRSEAAKREHAIKAMTRAKKEAIILEQSD
ncbi:MAG: GIY-YIG nuclease family protein [Gammaproteobacteria bacterium]|nr:GIY-YIG nuclease family protein [Gammaproteobacteria bacterium]